MKIAGMVLLVFAMAGAAMAGWVAAVPEIDGGSAATGLAFLSGALLVIKSRKKK